MQNEGGTFQRFYGFSTENLKEVSEVLSDESATFKSSFQMTSDLRVSLPRTHVCRIGSVNVTPALCGCYSGLLRQGMVVEVPDCHGLTEISAAGICPQYFACV